ncbi:MAG: RagB/SusD family nutrient uptake outer membrane protein [Prevotella sp.]|nr:RagB/SusD family nutrient uptake outer membrane protein [Prevotella sp.]
MKMKIKNMCVYTFIGLATLASTSCNDALDLEPISQITPGSYYSNADQLASYLNQYYDSYLNAPYSGTMTHWWGGWNEGKAASDNNTDIYVSGGGNTQLFANNHWEVASGKTLQDYYTGVRVYNFFINEAEAGIASGKLSGADVNNYLGEAYFFRAICYFRMMAHFGDLPILKEVLEDNNEVLVANSERAPRNEVARFILEDLDKAISLLQPRSVYNGQRLNKEAALLFKSRVALFEATFETYHKVSVRVPGDSNWPGAKMAYNSGKSFNIDGEVQFFLREAMSAAKQVGDAANLTANNHVIQPQIGTTTGWNAYFNMFSQPSLAKVGEVLVWKEYSGTLGYTHDVPYRVKIGCRSGFTRTFVESFLMQNGLPIYANGSGYHGDTTLDLVKQDRDERLQLFVWGANNVVDTDPEAPEKGKVFMADDETNCDRITSDNQEIRNITGYQIRKYYTYDFAQTPNDQRWGTDACPVFRTAEALLNYMEACYELNGSLDNTAQGYWRQLRQRAGVSTDFEATINATDLSKEGDFGVYSGTTQVDKTLYNIRRERVNELFAEGLRFADLVRWRSFDNMLTTKWIPEGANFWDEMYKHYPEGIKADGSADAVVSQKSLSKYLRPFSISMLETNELRDGYNWHEAYYLYPIGISDIRTASADRDIATSNLYQNPYWPTTAGGRAEK